TEAAYQATKRSGVAGAPGRQVDRAVETVIDGRGITTWVFDEPVPPPVGHPAKAVLTYLLIHCYLQMMPQGIPEDMLESILDCQATMMTAPSGVEAMPEKPGVGAALARAARSLGAGIFGDLGYGANCGVAG